MARRQQLPDGEHVGTRHLDPAWRRGDWRADRDTTAASDDTPCCPDGQPKEGNKR